MKKYFDKFGTLRNISDTIPDVIKEHNSARVETISHGGIGLLMQSMIARAKGNVRVYPDMTGNRGFTVKKETVC
jgi:IMP dehydrogenase/GMP reductase